MLARLAAYAAVLLISPIGIATAESDRPLPLPEIIVEAAPAQAAVVGPAKVHSEATSRSADPAPAFEPFGLDVEPVVSGGIFAKWTTVETQIKSETRIFAHCRDGSWCPPAARRFLSVIDRGLARSGRARIGIINREINLSIIPTSDLSQWGVTDRWSTPIETFTTGRGDCEDYAIAKYVALRAAGVPKTDVRLVVIRNNAAGEDHAVVAVRLNGDWIILDNRWLALVRDREMWRATPEFELDDNGVRRFVGPAPTAKFGQAIPGPS
jgi:predicted transglutaminase-like cysteine proteinase